MVHSSAAADETAAVASRVVAGQSDDQERSADRITSAMVSGHSRGNGHLPPPLPCAAS